MQLAWILFRHESEQTVVNRICSTNAQKLCECVSTCEAARRQNDRTEVEISLTAATSDGSFDLIVQYKGIKLPQLPKHFDSFFHSIKSVCNLVKVEII